MSGNNYYPVIATYQHHNNAALCIRFEDEDEDHWFPMVTIKHDDPLINYERSDSIEFEAQEWILLKNDLDYLVEP